MWQFGAGRLHKDHVTTYYAHAVAWRLMGRIDERAAAITAELGAEQVDLMSVVARNLEHMRSKRSDMFVREMVVERGRARPLHHERAQRRQAGEYRHRANPGGAEDFATPRFGDELPAALRLPRAFDDDGTGHDDDVMALDQPAQVMCTGNTQMKSAFEVVCGSRCYDRRAVVRTATGDGRFSDG